MNNHHASYQRFLTAGLGLFLLLLATNLITTNLFVSTAAAQAAPNLAGKNIVFVIGEQEYKTNETLKTFADQHLLSLGAACTFVLVNPDDPNDFPGIEKLQNADLLVLSLRRRTLSTEAFGMVRAYFDAGKPLVAIRTSSHAFFLRREAPPAGHEEWPTFDVDILGHKYEGHFGNDLHPTITVAPDAKDHQLLEGISDLTYVSGGSLYQSRALAPTTQVLLEGTITEKGVKKTEPVAWTNRRKIPNGQQNIFYTSLGHTTDFDQPGFQTLLQNAILWALTN